MSVELKTSSSTGSCTFGLLISVTNQSDDFTTYLLERPLLRSRCFKCCQGRQTATFRNKAEQDKKKKNSDFSAYSNELSELHESAECENVLSYVTHKRLLNAYYF